MLMVIATTVFPSLMISSTSFSLSPLGWAILKLISLIFSAFFRFSGDDTMARRKGFPSVDFPSSSTLTHGDFSSSQKYSTILSQRTSSRSAPILCPKNSSGEGNLVGMRIRLRKEY